MTNYYLISKNKDAAVKVFHSTSKFALQSRGNGGIIFASLEELTANPNISSGLAVEVYNSLASKAVVKFENKEAALRRTFGAITEAHEAGKLQTVGRIGGKEGEETGQKTTKVVAKSEKPAKAPKKPKGENSEKKGTRRGKVIELVPGSKNPYRVGSLSYKSFEMLAAAPKGTLYSTLVEKGIRVNTVNGMLAKGLARNVD